jgi:hypothetical protein
MLMAGETADHSDTSSSAVEDGCIRLWSIGEIAPFARCPGATMDYWGLLARPGRPPAKKPFDGNKRVDQNKRPLLTLSRVPSAAEIAVAWREDRDGS